MKETLEFLLRHGHTVLFLWIFLQCAGLPIPSTPILLAAGALAKYDNVGIQNSIAIAVAASVLGDSFWFGVGRQRGSRVLHWICRISLEPDSCVRRTEDLYVRYGAKSLVIAKFVPGFGAVAAPLAGIFHMRWYRWVLFDMAGAALWTGTYINLGYIFSNQLEDVLRYAMRLGEFLGVLVISCLTGYIAWKYIQRRKFFHDLRLARIAPDELKSMLDAGNSVQIVDLRSGLDYEADPFTLPGAIHIDPKNIESHIAQIVTDRDVILYCT